MPFRELTNKPVESAGHVARSEELIYKETVWVSYQDPNQSLVKRSNPNNLRAQSVNPYKLRDIFNPSIWVDWWKYIKNGKYTSHDQPFASVSEKSTRADSFIIQ